MIKNTTILLSLIFLFSSCDEKVRKVSIETDHGNMTFELYNSTPKHRDNFVKLVKEHFYDDMLFHRIISGFMIQGGDPDSRNASPDQRLGTGGPGYQIDAEIGAPHYKGTLAAARTGGPGNPEKKSSGSQFYIVQGTPQSAHGLENIAKTKGIQYNDEQIDKYTNLGGAPNLDMEYTVFGEIIDGIDVIDKIAAVQKGPADRPIIDLKMRISLIN